MRSKFEIYFSTVINYFLVLEIEKIIGASEYKSLET